MGHAMATAHISLMSLRAADEGDEKQKAAAFKDKVCQAAYIGGAISVILYRSASHLLATAYWIQNYLTRLRSFNNLEEYPESRENFNLVCRNANPHCNDCPAGRAPSARPFDEKMPELLTERPAACQPGGPAPGEGTCIGGSHGSARLFLRLWSVRGCFRQNATIYGGTGVPLMVGWW